MTETAQLDAPIEEIRELRHQISARCENDPVKLIDYYLELQEKYRDRLIEPQRTSERKDQSAA
jgi:hypothetical protein